MSLRRRKREIEHFERLAVVPMLKNRHSLYLSLLVLLVASATGCDSSGGIGDLPPGEPTDTTSIDDPAPDDSEPGELEHLFSVGTDDGVYFGYLSELSSLELLPGTEGMDPFTFDIGGNILLSGPSQPVQSWRVTEPIGIEDQYIEFYPSMVSTTHRGGASKESIVFDQGGIVRTPDVTLLDLRTGESTVVMEDAVPIGIGSDGLVVTLHGDGTPTDSAYVRLFNPVTHSFESGPFFIPGLTLSVGRSTVVAHYRSDIDVLVLAARGAGVSGTFTTAVYISEQLEPLEMVFATPDPGSIVAVYPFSDHMVYAHRVQSGPNGFRELIRMNTARRDNTFDVLIPSDSVLKHDNIYHVIFAGQDATL